MDRPIHLGEIVQPDSARRNSMADRCTCISICMHKRHSKAPCFYVLVFFLPLEVIRIKPGSGFKPLNRHKSIAKRNGMIHDDYLKALELTASLTRLRSQSDTRHSRGTAGC